MRSCCLQPGDVLVAKLIVQSNNPPQSDQSRQSRAGPALDHDRREEGKEPRPLAFPAELVPGEQGLPAEPVFKSAIH